MINNGLDMADFKVFGSRAARCGLSHSNVRGSGSDSCLPSESGGLGWTASAKPHSLHSLSPHPCGSAQAAGWRRRRAHVMPGVVVCGDQPSSRERPPSSSAPDVPCLGYPVRAPNPSLTGNSGAFNYGKVPLQARAGSSPARRTSRDFVIRQRD